MWTNAPDIISAKQVRFQLVSVADVFGAYQPKTAADLLAAVKESENFQICEAEDVWFIAQRMSQNKNDLELFIYPTPLLMEPIDVPYVEDEERKIFCLNHCECEEERRPSGKEIGIWMFPFDESAIIPEQFHFIVRKK